ncbi:4-hydroxyphenylacetate 3-monooxygenase, oxygenase component [Bacillus sp. PS06]|uniref:4-hydroxyphenylacetate 3-monooxygenase, oxygenase component n=1 Tax=Bacillus sp. PS06 TaxID=2764176 RepID=UPI00177E6CB7|nr:4-hydroxyphenylacetate 3-monooxygenase, oxygenase component [Bacillus sp. PS06]MBD8067770.1 4-hydroxyphenylacetate 3-monooxygenase, oxygenase component [Bacillus sp. PS06]
MPAISGKEYIERINQLKSNVWIHGSQVKGNISEHPAFKGVMESQASLYDIQLDKEKSEYMTFISPRTNSRIGTSFLIPTLKSDLEKRRNMIQEWATSSLGMMGRSPDYMNTALTALAAGANVFDKLQGASKENLVRFYEEARENDYSFTHTFIHPQVNRAQFYLEELNEEIISAQVIDQNEEGIIVHGARLLATQGGMTDELIVFPSGGDLTNEFAFAFSIPSNTKGLTFICRESFSYQSSHFDHPLGSRFEEMDTVIVFDHVLVPWERVFFYDNPDCAKLLYAGTSFYPLILHQILTRRITKVETLIGVAQAIIDTINISEYQHVQDKISEMITGYESLKGLLFSAELQAKQDKWGTMAPALQPLYASATLFPTLYPRYVEILQLLGASGIITIPTEKDFESVIRPELDAYLQAAASNSEDRVKLFRLAWDLSTSAFAGRQTLYERFFFGDPVRLASNQYRGYDRKGFVERIKDFLETK